MKNYFKKFSIMFVMSLILVLGSCVSAFASDDGVVGIANLSNTSVNSAKVGDALKLPEIGWKRYDDTNENIQYNNVTFTKNSDMYNGTYHETLENKNARITIKFTGTKFRLIGLKIRKNFSYVKLSQMISVKIDGVAATKIENLINSSDTYIYKCLVYESLDLKNTTHTLEIATEDNLHWDFDAIDIENGYIVNPDESIILDKSTMNLTEGDSDKLTAITTPSAVGVTWTVSDPSIATIEVDPTNGKITKVNALKEGTCTITATTADGSNLSASCTINVTKKDVPKPDNPTTDTKTGAILIINLTDGETKVFDVSSSDVDKFKSWYNNKSEFENKLTYIFNKTVNSNISVEEDVVHNQITSFEIRKY